MLRKFCALLAFLFLGAAHGAGREAAEPSNGPPAGAPLRVYLTKRLSKRLDQPVEAKLIDPLFAFDRQVAPAGSRSLEP